MNYHILHIFFYLGVFTLSKTLTSRSIYRPTRVPLLSARWLDEKQEYYFQHPNLEPQAIFEQYDEDYFNRSLFPDGEIPSKKPQAPVNGSTLKELLEEFVQEIQSLQYKRTHYKNFTVIKQRDYNPKARSGLIIARFNNYPFVVKIFMETPQAFVYPFSKGFEPCCFFIMSGGISRYLAGFSRIKNRDALEKKINSDEKWRNKINIPRKWFWRPTNSRLFEVKSKYLGTQDQTITLPSVYVIICDAVDAPPLSLLNKDDRIKGMELSHFFGTCIDSHINNFLKIVDPITGSETFAIVDTEHFSTMIGLREPMRFNDYVNWYWKLATKCIGDGYFRTKKKRLLFQCNTPPLLDQ